ncbi:MAG: A/G-specific adenine glycosylase [Bacilli bacterium]|nr:A/G-specific adenine glycosylase [Bacilli bacterium]
MISSIANTLLSWYAQHKRTLPWRNTHDPYAIWVSEMMLQQTQVNTVLPYYERFLEEIPTVHDLAYIDDEKLMKQWQGLGYYSRVKNMKKAALIVVNEMNGKFPSTWENIIRLPGIGEYSAGAILSIAYDLPYPAIDGNVMRVFARLVNEEEEVTNPKIKQKMKEVIKKTLPPIRCGDYNQALMDLGATICLGNGVPKCGMCPLNACCKAYDQGTQTLIPRKVPKKERIIEEWMILLIHHHEKWLIHQRSSEGLLASMWEYPMIPIGSQKNVLSFCESFGFIVDSLHPARIETHLFTHKKWIMTSWIMKVTTDKVLPKGYVWATLDDIHEIYSLATAYEPFTHLLLENKVVERLK